MATVGYSVLFGGLKLLSYAYDALLLIPSVLIYRPFSKLRQSKRIKATATEEGDPGSAWRCVESPQVLTTTPFDGCQTLSDLFDRAVRLHGNQPCFGTREVLAEEDEVQPNGKVFKKLVLGEYTWQSYKEVSDAVSELGRGLLALGLESCVCYVAVFAETRAEWLISALACFKYNFPVVTIYATLGEDAMAYGINEGECQVVITSTTLVSKVKAALPRLKHVKHVIYMDQGEVKRVGSEGIPPSVQLHSMTDMKTLGRGYSHTEVPVDSKAQGKDIAVIMYTSGATGIPKGVMISNANLMSGMSGQIQRIPNLGPADTYIAYLPLAHVLELSAELSCVSYGVKIGYSSPLTLSDQSSKIKRGSQGDATVLKPTLLAAVPAIMDRIYKSVWDKVDSSGPFAKALFSFAYEYKKRNLRRGMDTPLLNRMVFKSIRKLLGGRVRLILSGAAPLADDTMRFMNICFCCPVGQGYGLTETCGAGTIQEVTDMSTGRVGAPLICNEIILRDWEEGSYTTGNVPPQGEVLIGGGNVTMGYYNNPGKTKEDFKVINGTRYFCTGDIGEFQHDGCLKIIDRKKDLVKLQAGEYVSLGKVETELKMSPLVDNICVYGDSSKDYVIALVVPKKKNVTDLAKKMGVSTDDWHQLCSNETLKKEIMTSLLKYAKSGKLERFEIPKKIHVCEEEWTSDNGMLTDAFKLKRRNLQKQYQQVIDTLYV